MKSKSIKLFFVIVMLVMLLWTLPVRAADPTPEPDTPAPVLVDQMAIPDLPKFLERLTGPEGALLIGVLISVLAAKWPWYQAQSSSNKRWIALGLTAGIAAIACLLLSVVPPAVWVELAPVWTILASAALAWLGGEGWYQAALRNKPVQGEFIQSELEEVKISPGVFVEE